MTHTQSHTTTMDATTTQRDIAEIKELLRELVLYAKLTPVSVENIVEDTDPKSLGKDLAILCYNVKFDDAKKLLDTYSNISVLEYYNGRTALMSAAMYNKIELMDSILRQNKECIDTVSMFDKYTALMYACVTKNAKAVEFLLKNGADYKIKTDEKYYGIENYDKARTAYEIAKIRGYVDVLNVFHECILE